MLRRPFLIRHSEEYPYFIQGASLWAAQVRMEMEIAADPARLSASMAMEHKSPLKTGRKKMAGVNPAIWFNAFYYPLLKRFSGESLYENSPVYG